MDPVFREFQIRGLVLYLDCLLHYLVINQFKICFLLSDYYKARKNTKVESKGQRYELDDFIVKVGSVVLGQTTSFKGVLVEVRVYFYTIVI